MDQTASEVQTKILGWLGEASGLPAPALLKAFGGRAPRFNGHRSQVCQETADGQIWVGVFAVAGSRSEGGRVSTTLYEAYMRTTEAGLAEDSRSFEAFVSRAKIGTPAES